MKPFTIALCWQGRKGLNGGEDVGQRRKGLNGGEDGGGDLTHVRLSGIVTMNSPCTMNVC
jgi:hypothetical protein